MRHRRFTQLLLAATLAAAALVFTLFAGPPVQAQAVTEDFNSFTGAGFSPTPTPGQLDSNKWIVNGLSEGSMAFGDTKSSPSDFGRGTSTGGVTTGGIYAFNVGSGNIILGVQPVGADFTPGSITYRYVNTSTVELTSLDVGYALWYRNDQGYASYVQLEHSSDCATYTVIPSLTITTPTATDTTPTWISQTITTTISGLNIPSTNGVFCVRWLSDDAGGSGSRDEFGIDDVAVKPTESTLIDLADFHAEVAGDQVRLIWETAVELDNAGFNVYRAAGQGGHYVQLNPALIAAQADPGHGARYEYADQPGPGIFYYLLEDVDTAGKATRHGPVTAEVRTTGSLGSGALYLPVISH